MSFIEPLRSLVMRGIGRTSSVHVEEELFEARSTRGRLAFSLELHDVVLGLHETMDARRAPNV